jgi:hypothetical protein
MSGITPTASKKRGRMLRTDAGREISHEEVVYGLIKRTAIEVANTGTCACGGAILQPKKGRKVTMCLACKGVRNREASRARKCKSKRVKSRQEFSAAHNIAQAHSKEVRRRKSQSRLYKAAIDSGVCVDCRGRPRVHGKSRCQQCRERVNKKAMLGYVPKKRACVYKCALCDTRGHSRRTCPQVNKGL